MADARVSSNTLVWVGSESWLQHLADRDDIGTDVRYLRSLDVAGTTALDNIPTLGSDGIEAQINQYGLSVSGDLLYDKEVYKLLNDHQEDTDNLMVVVFDDHGSQKREMSSDTDRSAYVFPVSWSGVPTSNPTNALITTSVEFLLNGEAVDAGTVSPAKTRAREICTLKAGTGPAAGNAAVYEDMLGGASPAGFFSANPADRVFLVVSKWVSATSSGKDIA